MSVPDFIAMEDELVARIATTVADLNGQVFAATSIQNDTHLLELVRQPPSCVVAFTGLTPNISPERDAIGQDYKFRAGFATILIGRSVRAASTARPTVTIHSIARDIIASLISPYRVTGSLRALKLTDYVELGEDPDLRLVSWRVGWDTIVLVSGTT